MSLPDASPVLDLIEAFRRSKTMFAALSMGVFDRLAGGPMSVAQLAEAVDAPAGPLERLLEGCASLGLLERHGDSFANAPVAAAYLAKQSPHSLAGYVQYSNDVLYPMWANLQDAVREDTHRWRQTFQLSSGELFDRFFHTDEAMRTFLMGMHGFGMLSSPAVVRAFDLGRFRQLVDLGGATGHLAVAACGAYPELRATVFDLPRVAEFAKEMVAEAGVQDRVNCVAGDFFADPLPRADLYALGRILHDWSTGKIDRLLRKIVAALPAGGGLLVAEKLMADDHLGPVHVHMQSLNMLVCTEGRERSLPEYRDLLLRAGFQKVEGVRTGQPVDAILAIR